MHQRIRHNMQIGPAHGRALGEGRSRCHGL
jgi:hypothetical protein